MLRQLLEGRDLFRGVGGEIDFSRPTVHRSESYGRVDEPRYAELVRVYRAAQEDEGRDDAPVRGFITPGSSKQPE
ncbi:hypothetical protein AABB02_11915 [Streptomyces rimosus]|uniref:hypothetical protein n=1 Tax=Streptomyces rimosus TaxID=1927 RepID=UPI0031DC041C